MTLKLLVEIAGWLGSLLILLAYALLATHKIKSNSRIYQLFNIFGSLFLIFNTVYNGAIPPAFLNVIWLVIGIYSLFRSASHRRKG